jgi:hypothetical protein
MFEYSSINVGSIRFSEGVPIKESKTNPHKYLWQYENIVSIFIQQTLKLIFPPLQKQRGDK